MPLDLLTRKKGGRPQVGLTPKERRRNIRDCFRVKEPCRLQRRNILIVDDVLTTGATANECARVLKREGAREVCLLVLAGAFDA
jgi:predicted amidophosphoribosyltransferase